jgi:hypothetical protein
MNLEIKPIQIFRDAHRDRGCVRVFIKVSAHMCMNIVYTVLCDIQKKYVNQNAHTRANAAAAEALLQLQTHRCAADGLRACLFQFFLLFFD